MLVFVIVFVVAVFAQVVAERTLRKEASRLR